jgi:hypothetical protein
MRDTENNARMFLSTTGLRSTRYDFFYLKLVPGPNKSRTKVSKDRSGKETGSQRLNFDSASTTRLPSRRTFEPLNPYLLPPSFKGNGTSSVCGLLNCICCKHHSSIFSTSPVASVTASTQSLSHSA